MTITPTQVEGAYIVALEPVADERGLFARTWCAEEFAQHGLVAQWSQCNLSFSRKRGTVRGLHFQAAPHGETKLVRVTRGAAFDVAADLRPESATFGRWTAVELTAENRLALYVPIGCAHGLQTLADDTEVFYQMSAPYVPAAARGLRWNDPLFQIQWPLEVASIADRDRSYEDYRR